VVSGVPAVERERPPIPAELAWLEERIADYRQRVLDEPFFEALERAREPRDFGWARHLLHHSREFPDILALRRDRNTRPGHQPFLDEHVEAERGHADMLTEWLHTHGLVPTGEAAPAPRPTPATVACIAHAYRTALVLPSDEHIVSLNVALEAASFDFFNRASPHLDALGIGHEYWRVHMELDEFHSADGLALLTPVDEGSPEGRRLDHLARETLLFWGFMLNSWVGVDRWPHLPLP
jgi:hypothetical protein